MTLGVRRDPLNSSQPAHVQRTVHPARAHTTALSAVPPHGWDLRVCVWVTPCTFSDLAGVFRTLGGMDGALQTLVSTTGAPGDPIVLFSDSDYANDPETRKSISDKATYLFGCLVSWQSKRQPVIASSTHEAVQKGKGDTLHSPSAVHPFGDTRAERAVVVTSDTLRSNRGAYTARGQSHLKLNE